MNSNDVHMKAAKTYPLHSQTHATPTRVFKGAKQHPTLSGTFIPDQVNNDIKTRTTILQSPISSVNASMLNGGTLDIRVERGVIDLITSAYVKIGVTNDTGASATIAPSPFLINKIDIFAANSAQLLTTIYAQEIWLSLALLSQQEFEQLTTLFGTNANYATTGTVLASGVSTSFYVPIYNILSTSNLYLSGLKGELIIKLYFNPTSLTHLAGSLVHTDSIQLLLKGYREPQKVKDQRMSLYSGKYLIPVITNQRMNQVITLAASTSYSILLSGLKGLIGGIFFTMRNAVITGATQGTYYLEFDQLDVQNADGSSLLGFYKRPIAERGLDSCEMFNNRMTFNSNFVYIGFAENIVNDVITGSNSGMEVFNGFEKLVFTTSSAIAPAAYQIDIFALTHQALVINSNTIIATQ